MDELDALTAQGLQKQKLAPEFEQQLDERKKRLMNSTQVINQNLSPEGFNAPATNKFNTALGMPASGMDSDIYRAVTERNNSRNQDFVNTLKKDVEYMAPVREAQGLRQLGSDYGKVSEVAINNQKIWQQQELNQRRLKLYRQQQADSILGGVLGILGTIAGGVIGAATGGLGLGLFGAAASSGAGAGAGAIAKGAMTGGGGTHGKP